MNPGCSGKLGDIGHSYIGRRDNVSKLEGNIIWVIQGHRPRENGYCPGFDNPGIMNPSGGITWPSGSIISIVLQLGCNNITFQKSFYYNQDIFRLDPSYWSSNEGICFNP